MHTRTTSVTRTVHTFELTDINTLEVEVTANNLVMLHLLSRYDANASRHHYTTAVFFTHEWDAFLRDQRCLVLDLGYLIRATPDEFVRQRLDGTEEYRWAVPIELIRTASRRAFHQLKRVRRSPSPRYGDAPGTKSQLILTDRHRAFFSPAVRAHYTVPAGTILLLHPEATPKVEQVLDMARNQSRHQKDFRTVHFWSDGDTDLSFAVRTPEGHLTLSGGIIRHSGGYSIHT